MKEYNPRAIEKKWQKKWKEEKTFKVEDDKNKEKYYVLIEFPYPSGQGLHVGHPRPYTAMDLLARKKRLEGKNVLFPMGFDAFGLPTENYAIQNKIHPEKVTKKNIARFTKQLESLGYSFDWDRQINTTDPKYYKWTQWIFIQMFKKGLAYKKETQINWCPHDKVVLANEEVINGRCERCGSKVERRVKNQWMLKITEYADRLIDDLKYVDYPEKVKSSQINWIGRSYGMEINFKLNSVDDKLTIYTTRPDTLFGATYMVIASEHPYIKKYKDKIENYDQVKEYVDKAKFKSDFERELNKEKTGVEIKGIRAINPITGKDLPIWVSDYVLMSYGTGAIMAVPAHDTRDYEFAKKFNQEIIPVIEGGDIEKEAYVDINKGKMINSDFLNGLSVKDAKEKIMDYLEERSLGKRKKNFKLRDWIFSRQRYWGEPIPMIYCEDCGWVPEKEENLPILLPKVENYETTDTGESPLANIDEFVNTTCPICGKKAKRETDTMPQWAGSSWYYLRYMDPHNDDFLVGEDKVKYWSPVDWYNGGMEHTTLHLLYSRFWHKFLYDINVVPTIEPYKKRTSHGMILGSDHQKMSKSRGNVVNPDEVVEEYGADSLRTYELFIGDFEQSAPWSTNGVIGVRKFLDKVWRLQEIINDKEGISEDLEVLINSTIKKVSEDYETLKYNTAIAQLMTLTNEFQAKGQISKDELKILLILLNPVAPHITEEIWQENNFGEEIANSKIWPSYDESKLKSKFIEIPIQINGKLRSKLDISEEMTKEDILAMARNDEKVKENIADKKIVKEIYVKNKIINIVVR